MKMTNSSKSDFPITNKMKEDVSMRFVKLLSVFAAALLAYSTAFGQSGDFTTKGRVMTAGQPLGMVTVTYTNIDKRLSWDFSKSDGTFGGAIVSTINPAPQAKVTLPSDGMVTIDIFDMSGKLASTVSGKLNKGTYTLQPLTAKLTQAMYALKIKVGNTVTYQKMLNTGLKSGGHTISLSSSKEPMVLAKQLAAIDTVRIGKTGFTPVKIAIESYAADVGTVTLTPINIEAKVDSIFATMSQLDKCGQLAMPPNTNANATNSISNNIGSIFGGGGALLGSSAAASATYIDTIQKRMMTSSTRKIPIMAAYDMVHGASAVPGAVMLPHNLAMGAIQDTLLMQKAFRVMALEVRGSGLNWGFGPCIAVIRDDRWGRAYEGFCETPERTQIMARHAVLGIQTTDLSLPMAYAACAKHFAGDGNTKNGTNTGVTEGPDNVARAINLPGYTAAVQAGVATIMPSFSSWCDGVHMHQNKTLLTGWLKSTTAGPGFAGFLVGDYEAAWPLPTCSDAGVDVPMAPGTNFGIISTNDAAHNNNFNSLYNSGAAAAARIDDAVKRVLRVKCWMNLFSPEQYMTDRRLTALVGCQAHRDVARACVRASQVLLKNANNVIPIPKGAKVAMVGDAANDMGIQCGGWTVSWQGQSGAIPGGGGTTFYQGVQQVNTGGTVTLGSYTNSDYVVAFFSETPYAETDFPSIALSGIAHSSTSNAAIITMVQAAHAAGKKVIGVLVAGRVLDITSVIDNCDAFVWSGLPGTEGKGLAEVLFADQGYKFTGKLPVTWPMNSAQEPINSGDNLVGRYPYAFGLTD